MPVSRRYGGTPVTSLASMQTLPASGASKPATTFKSVVLQQPLGPSSVMNSPLRIGSETSRTAASSPNVLLTPTMSTAHPASATSTTSSASMRWVPALPNRSTAIDRQDSPQSQQLIGRHHGDRGGDDHERRDRRDGRIGILAYVGIHGDGKRLRAARGDVERGGELGQRQDRGHQPTARHAGQHQRQRDPGENSPWRRAEVG